MRVYLAAAYRRADEIRQIALRLGVLGIETTSRWVYGWGVGNPRRHEVAMGDLEDIRRANLLLFFAEDETAGYMSGGRHVEFGIAIERGMRIHVIGKPENLFHQLRGVLCFSNLDSWISFIAGEL